jgi:lipoate synthase
VYVVVCFSLYQKKSLLYEECETPVEIHDAVRKCLQKDAHIISIRQYLRG